METERMLRELRSVKSKEKNKQYHTFETDVHSMVSDVIPKIKKLLQYEKLEEQIYPTTLEKLANVTIEMANKAEGKQADHIHLLSDKESYKWEKLLSLEEQIGMPLKDFCTCMFHNGDYFYAIIENDDTEQLEIVEVEKEDGYMNQYSQGTFYFTGESEKGIFYEYPISCYGKDMFLTLDEAEKKLEEMKNENK